MSLYCDQQVDENYLQMYKLNQNIPMLSSDVWRSNERQTSPSSVILGCQMRVLHVTCGGLKKI